MFQYHKVQFRVQIRGLCEDANPWFQYHKVQFRVQLAFHTCEVLLGFNTTRCNSEIIRLPLFSLRKLVSIPQGAIQSIRISGTDTALPLFQYHKVQFRANFESNLIPSSSWFQYHKVQFRAAVRSNSIPVSPCFNTTRCNSEHIATRDISSRSIVSIPQGAIQSF